MKLEFPRQWEPSCSMRTNRRTDRWTNKH